jgi:hypothetical protein
MGFKLISFKLIGFKFVNGLCSKRLGSKHGGRAAATTTDNRCGLTD